MDKAFIDSLRKKAADLIEERDKLQLEMQKGHNRMAALNGAIAGIDQLIKLDETDSVSSGQGELIEKLPAEESTGLPGVLEAVMADKKYRTLDEVTDAVKAAGYDFGERHPKKAVGFTLLGLKRGGKFMRNDVTKKWIYIG